MPLALAACSADETRSSGAVAPAAASAPGPAPAAASAPPPVAPPAAAPPRPVAARAPEVVLLEPGKAPRVRLRYDLPDSYREKIGMTMVMAMEMGTSGQTVRLQLPPLGMEMQLDVIEKLDDSRVRCKFAVTGAKVLPGGDATFATMRDHLGRELKKAVGVAGTLVMDDRGLSRGMDLALPPDMDPQMRSAMESSRQAMEQLSSPLPEEPVGVGARWQVEQTIEQNGLRLAQKSVYQLVKLKGARGSLKTTITQSADPQVVALPNLPADFKAELLSHSGKGKGGVELDLKRPVPRRSTVAIKTDSSIKVTGQGQEQTMQMKADTKVTVGR